MKRHDLDPVETLNRFARRGLWLALLLVLILGICAALLSAAPHGEAAATAGRVMSLLPIGIIIAVAWLVSSRRGQSIRTANLAMRIVMDDELRRASTQRAYRAAFFGMLLCQPVLGGWFAWLPSAAAPQLMAIVTVVVGVSGFLGIFLFGDRP